MLRYALCRIVMSRSTRTRSVPDEEPPSKKLCINMGNINTLHELAQVTSDAEAVRSFLSRWQFIDENLKCQNCEAFLAFRYRSDSRDYWWRCMRCLNWASVRSDTVMLRHFPKVSAVQLIEVQEHEKRQGLHHPAHHGASYELSTWNCTHCGRELRG